MPRIYKIFFDIYLLDIIRRQEILLIIVYITNRYTYMLCCIIIIKYIIETMRLIARALLSPIPDNNNNNFYDIYRQIIQPDILSISSISFLHFPFLNLDNSKPNRIHSSQNIVDNFKLQHDGILN